MANPLYIASNIKPPPPPSQPPAIGFRPSDRLLTGKQKEEDAFKAPARGSSRSSGKGATPVRQLDLVQEVHGGHQHQQEEASGWQGQDGRSRDFSRGQGHVSPEGVSPAVPSLPVPDGRHHHHPLTTLQEGKISPIRTPDYYGTLRQFGEEKKEVPNFMCSSKNWDLCASRPPARNAHTALNHTVGQTSSGPGIQPISHEEDRYVTDEGQMQVDVVFFRQLTSTGIHEPVLVLYMDLLNTNVRYLLYLHTNNPITNSTGLAKQLIEFSPPPTLENCKVTQLHHGNGSWFRGACLEVKGKYYPVLLQWSYHFNWYGTKTVFYHGARTSFDFTLPSGLESNNYKVYVSIKAIDGKGVSYKYSETMSVVVYPRSTTGDGVFLIFKDIALLENENPSLLLQQVRTLAWELNHVFVTDVTQTVMDNILALIFYGSCKESLETVTDPPPEDQNGGLPLLDRSYFTVSPTFNRNYNSEYFIEVNLLKSCARDHLAEIVVNLPMRDEMEIIQVLTALEMIIDAEEFISSKTYTRVITAMHTAHERMLFSYNSEVRTQAAYEFFVLSSAVLDKQTEIYDWNSTSIHLSTTVISLLLDVMQVETRARFLEEEPLSWQTAHLVFHGYLAEAENINRWYRTVSFVFEPESIPYGVHLVQSLNHARSPYNITDDPVTTEVIHIDIHIARRIPRAVKVKIRRSEYLLGPEYDFRRNGVLTPESLSVYEFSVQDVHETMAFHVLLQIMRVLNPEYPVAAVILICEDLQKLKEPLYKQELMATQDAAQTSLIIPPNTLPHGKMMLIIMDKNSYENNWARYNTSSEMIGADFMVSAWWSRCLLWDNSEWIGDNCTEISEQSSWDYTVCRCKSKYSVYAAQSIPILNEESKMDVNQLMLHETYIALYFMVLCLVVYFVLALALQTSARHRLRRRNIWLRDNKPEHEWAYLLTIKTGTQHNAGTTSKVYVILHGTDGMSETRELQSKQTGQLFTRGALCTFILTTPEPLGDILKVQVWHDNSGGSDSGWYVCETSVADLVLGARYAYPCYRWLSVQAEDAKVEREITLDSPTKFLQDFEHFLPQYASEHMLWTSLLTTSSTAKFYRLQRLTICLIICLCLGTVSLGVVQRINKEHTMMVPDMHIEPLYFGLIIAVLLLPVQWLLEMVFKMSNRLEEKEYNAKAVLDTLRATTSATASGTSRDNIDVSSQEDNQSNSNDDETDEDTDIYDPNAKIWKELSDWAHTAELSINTDIIHPSLLESEERDDVHLIQRPRTSTINESSRTPVNFTFSNGNRSLSETFPATTLERNVVNVITENHESENAKKCSPTILHFFSELRKTFSFILYFFSKNKKKLKLEKDGWRSDDDEEDDDDLESDELGVTSNIIIIFSQCVGWMICCFFAALCCMVLFVSGSGMPKDYGALWLHIVYITLCCSMFLMQPLVVIIYTLYKVCMYRWLGCRGCISSCVTVPLDQVVAIWNRYQTVLLRRHHTVDNTNKEKLLEERKRTRDLRFAHPPSENYLLKCREKEVRLEKVSTFLRNVVGHLLLLVLLLMISSNVHVKERFGQNRAIYLALENGTCLDSARYLDACTDTGSNSDSCNQQEDDEYMKFRNIDSKEDWWKWAFSELLALTYNMDKSYSIYNTFCDSNSILIGMPRLRKYDIGSVECEATKVKISNNRSLADFLNVDACYPEYEDNVTHLFSFGSSIDKEYEWDAHVLAINHGKYSKYSYTSHKQDLATSRFGTIMTLTILEATNWLDESSTRAVVTEFTLYHPQQDVFTTVNLLAEFPSLSGVEVKSSVWSSHVERYTEKWAYTCMVAEILLLAISLYYFNRTVVYIYTCRFRIWKSFWGVLDILMTMLSCTYIICLMLRVQIAEDAMWQMRVAYFQKYVNLKGLTTWDDFLEALIGGMLTVHLLRCLRLLRYFPRFRRLGLVMANAAKDVFIISIVMIVMLIACIMLGQLWFSTILWEFHTFSEALLTIIRITVTHMPFLATVENESSGITPVLGHLYYLLAFIFIYQVMRALYIASYMYAHRSYIEKPGYDVQWKDIIFYIKERWQSLLGWILRRKDKNVQTEDNTPPDFYMAELELQINQVMNGLENLADLLGLVMEKMEDIEEETAFLESSGPCIDEVWQPEDDEVNSCGLKTKLETMSKTLQVKVDSMRKIEEEELNCQSGKGTFVNEYDENVYEPRQDDIMDAFSGIASGQTLNEEVTRYLTEDLELRKQDDGGQLAKFLEDVSVAPKKNVTSYGKYGKKDGKLKGSSKVTHSHDYLTPVNISSNSYRIDRRGVIPAQSAISHQKVTDQPDSPPQGPLGINTRLCRTQTQGRGKGHVDAMDFEPIELDSEDESEW